jgi:crotonobetainyl-CoA:carnitine CoA-transferase CaiB-like acyl-CoA transferase
MSRPLSGVRVLDLSTVVMAPWASQMLADMGADVIKVEAPGGDLTRQTGPRRHAGMASLFLSVNRNKRSIVLDLQQSEGREALLRLMGDADVLMHNLRPQVAARLQLRYEDLAAEFPRLVYCGAYGFRKEGPMANHPAYDDIIQAASGLADLMTVLSDQPRYVPTIVADKICAYAVSTGVLGALFQRERSGRGQAIEVAMFESMVDFVMVEHLYGACFDPPIDKLGYSRILTKERRPYATCNGHLAVLPYSDQNWRDFFQVAGRSELIEDPRFSTTAARVDHADDLYRTAGDIIAQRSTEEWMRILEPLHIPMGRVNSKEDLLTNEQLQASNFWRVVDHPTEGRIRMSDAPIRFSDSDFELRHMPPQLGQHSEQLLVEAGYSPQEIDRLVATKVTARPKPA